MKDKNKIIEYLENKIKGCDELGGMEKEKWAFQQCLKESRRILAVQEEEAKERYENALKYIQRQNKSNRNMTQSTAVNITGTALRIASGYESTK